MVPLISRAMGEWNSLTFQGSFERNLKDIFEPLGVTRDVIRKGHPEDNAFVERSLKDAMMRNSRSLI